MPHDEEMERVACRCVDALIGELKPTEAELVRRVELENEPVSDAARSTGVSPNKASVTLHRARKKLRERLGPSAGNVQRAHVWTVTVHRKASRGRSNNDGPYSIQGTVVVPGDNARVLNLEEGTAGKPA